MVKRLNLPMSEPDTRNLKVGDSVLLSGIIVTGRDAVHKWIYDNFISKKTQPSPEDVEVLNKLRPLVSGGLIYHCGPVVSGLDSKNYKFVAAGPTTSIREEPYQGAVMRFLNMRGVIGKGGMGDKSLKAFEELPAVYFHAIGGAASLIAESVTEVLGVYKLEFGVPEAIWVVRVQDFPAIVTMDSHGSSIHSKVRSESKKVLDRLII